jgi:UDP-3-O-acyl-N-acetylglucosamine deacetylase
MLPIVAGSAVAYSERIDEVGIEELNEVAGLCTLGCHRLVA